MLSQISLASTHRPFFLSLQCAESSFLPIIHCIFDIMRKDILAGPFRTGYPDQIVRLCQGLKIPLNRSWPYPLQTLLDYLLDREGKGNRCIICRKRGHDRRHIRDDYCKPHWKEVHPKARWDLRKYVQSKCKEKRCSKQRQQGVYETQYCRRHYRQHYSEVMPRKRKLCTVNGCKKQEQRPGYCIKHFIESDPNPTQEWHCCKEKECRKRRRFKGYCLSHYTKIYREKPASYLCLEKGCKRVRFYFS